MSGFSKGGPLGQNLIRKRFPLAPFGKSHFKDDPNVRGHREKIDIGFRLHLYILYMWRVTHFNGWVQNSLKQQPDHLQSLTHFFFLSDLADMVLFLAEKIYSGGMVKCIFEFR